VIGSAIAVGAVSILVMKRTGMRTARGEEIQFPDRALARPRIHHVLDERARLQTTFAGARDHQ
jgi:hypothetical protein